MTLRSAAAALLVALGAGTAASQTRPPHYAEYRLDAIVGNGTAVQGGGGITFPMGNYVRFGLLGAAGPLWSDGVTRLSGRVDGIARFTFDPLREVPVALSLGGGVSIPLEASATRVRPRFVAVIDLEGKRRGRFSPAAQIGLGGGLRLGAIVRTSGPRAR